MALKAYNQLYIQCMFSFDCFESGTLQNRQQNDFKIWKWWRGYKDVIQQSSYGSS